tara:strand:- start:3601 stop:3966 length:366 start_codon:yes stop_codon:yes gene_type:complete
MNWQIILKKKRPLFNVFNVSELVREATREWADTVTPGESFFIFHIRRNIIPFLEPKLKTVIEPSDPDRVRRAITAFITKNFKLKDVQNSIYDITIFNVLQNQPNWIIKGKSAARADFKKVE